LQDWRHCLVPKVAPLCLCLNQFLGPS